MLHYSYWSQVRGKVCTVGVVSSSIFEITIDDIIAADISTLRDHAWGHGAPAQPVDYYAISFIYFFGLRYDFRDYYVSSLVLRRFSPDVFAFFSLRCAAFAFRRYFSFDMISFITLYWFRWCFILSPLTPLCFRQLFSLSFSLHWWYFRFLRRYFRRRCFSADIFIASFCISTLRRFSPLFSIIDIIFWYCIIIWLLPLAIIYYIATLIIADTGQAITSATAITIYYATHITGHIADLFTEIYPRDCLNECSVPEESMPKAAEKWHNAAAQNVPYAKCKMCKMQNSVYVQR